MYKKENLLFKNMKQIDKGYGLNVPKIFEIEKELSTDEKITFIDELENGVATYMINLTSKWILEKDSLPKNSYGGIKIVSQKAWLRKNDTRNIVDKDVHCGRYYMFGNEYDDLSETCGFTQWGRELPYTGELVVHQWFHDLCTKLYYEELKYFKTVDTKSIKTKLIEEYAKKYNCLNNKTINDIKWYNDSDEVEELTLDIIIEHFEKLEKAYNEISDSLNDRIGGELK